jgi:three-Cys-motif partner protein
MPPKETIWAADEHTFAKHRLLRLYLDAWLPIMASRDRKLVLIDGFAGPGRYKGGQPGSPLVMLDAYVGHAQRGLPHMSRVQLMYVFIDQDKRRFAHLRQELAEITLPTNVTVVPVEGSFDVEITKLLDGLPGALAPTFAFVDPFGYTDADLELSSRILGFPRCEVLIYMPFPFIARFVDEAAIAPALTRLYGDETWRQAQGLTWDQKIQTLHDAFLAALLRCAKYARSFEIVGRAGTSGYHLFFATGHLRGLERMKEAMWKVDPIAGASFADSTTGGQLVLFENKPDLESLNRDVRAHFANRRFAIEEAETFTLEQTPFLTKHLRAVLRSIEQQGCLSAAHPTKPRRRQTYPDGTIVQITP